MFPSTRPTRNLHLVVTKLRAPGMGLLLGLAGLPALVIANPQGGSLVAGSASIQQQGNRVDIHQSSQTAIIDWRSFSIDAGEVTRFHQPSATALAVNRVITSEPSRLFGSLEANGRVMLINQNGIHVGPSGVIDVAGLVATTHNISNERILAGDFTFDAPADFEAGIINEGLISVGEEGLAALVSPQVSNRGVITAHKGSISIAAGEQPTLDLYGDGLIQFALDDAGVTPNAPEHAAGPVTLIDNSGTIQADGGLVQITARAAGELVNRSINMDGIVQAQTLDQQQGEIRLDGGERGEVWVNGKLDVSGTLAGESGGVISVAGERIGIVGELDASGSVDGGSIHLGEAPRSSGEGETAPLKTKRIVALEEAKVDASSHGTQGDGGEVILWSEEQTTFLGALDVRPGSEAGDGGFVELSSLGGIYWGGAEIETGYEGRSGTVLIDPKNVAIIGAAAPSVPSDWLYSDISDPRLINVADIEALLGPGGHVSIQAHNDIRLMMPLTGSGGRLDLSAGRSVIVGSNITTNGGELRISANDTTASGVLDAYRDPGDAVILMGPGATIDTGGGPVFLSMATGDRPVNNDTGAITLGTITAESFEIQHEGNTPGDVIINGAVDAANSVFIRNTSGGGITLNQIDAATIEVLNQGATPGSLTLNGTLAATGGVDYESLVVDAGAAFINNVGPGVLSAGGVSYRFVLYSTDPANNLMNGLVRDPWYNATYASLPPNLVPVGSPNAGRLVYSIAPVLTVTPGGATKEYGEPNPPLTTYSITGLINGDALGNAVTGAPALSTPADQNSDVTTPISGIYAPYVMPIYADQGTLESPYNYGFNFDNIGLLDITPAPLDVAVVNTSREYGDPNPPFEFSYTGLKNDEDGAVVIDTPPTVTTLATETSNIGAYSLDPSGGIDRNYSFGNYAPGTLQVTAAPLDFWVDAQSRPFGSANPTPIFYFTGQKFPDDNTGYTVTVEHDAQPDSNVGFYTPIVGFSMSPSNYQINTMNISDLEVTPAPITLTTSDVIKTYDATTDAAGTLQITGTLYGSDYVSGGTFAFTDPNAGTGNKTVELSGFTVIDGNGGANYQLNLVPNNTSTIAPAPLWVEVAAQTRLYGDPNPALEVTYTGQVVPDDPIGYSFGGYYPADPTSPVGDYAPLVSMLPPPMGSPVNYTIAGTNLEPLTVTPAPLTVIAEDQSRAYGSANPPLTLSYAGFRNGETEAVLEALPTASTAATATDNVGVYPITAGGGSGQNYQLSYLPGELTIDPAPITLSTSAVTKTYDGTTSAAGAPVVIAGSLHDPISGGNYAFLDPNAGSGKTVTVSNVTIADGNGGLNYDVTYVNNTSSTINPAPISVTTTDVIKGYDGTTDAAGVATLIAGTLYGSDRLSGGTFAFLDPDVGTGKTVTVSNVTLADGNGGGNYAITYLENYNSTIANLLLTITANPDSKVYDGITYSGGAGVVYDGFITGEDSSVLDGTLTYTGNAQGAVNAGSYTITPSGFSSTNYTIQFIDGTLTIDPAPITLSSSAVTKTYDGTTSAAGAPVLIAGSLYDPISGGNYAFLDPNAGNGKTVTVSNITIADGNGGLNYDVTYVDNTSSTINPAAISVTTTEVIKAYDGTTDAAGIATLAAGTLYGSDRLSGGTFAFLDPDVGTGKTVTVSNVTLADGNGGGNYAITYLDNHNSTITNLLLTISANPDSKIYDGIAYSGGVGVVFDGFTAGDDVSVLDGTLSYGGTAQGAVNAGTYTIVPSGYSSTNYSIQYVEGALTINPAPITLSTGDVVKTYDGTTSAIGTPVLTNGTLYDPMSGGNFTFLDPNAGTGKTVSVGGITIDDGNSGNNYAVTYLDNTNSTINKAPLLVSTGDASRQYGDPNDGVQLSYTGFVNGEDLSVLDSPPAVTTSAEQSSPLGDYPITISGGNDNNYALSVEREGTLTILPATLTVSVDDYSREYGEANPQFTFSLTGYKLGQDQGVLDRLPELATPATAASDAGDYPVTASGAAATNYTFSYNPGTLSVTTAPLTVSADDQRREYGDPNPQLTLAYDGFKLNDAPTSLATPPTATTEAFSTSAVGEYPIIVSGGASINYTFAYNSGTLEITPAPLLISADDQSRLVGTPNPPLTLQYAGFKLNDGPSVLDTPPQVATTAAQESPVGSYPITVSGASDLNYQITRQDGVLKVTQGAEVDLTPVLETSITTLLDQLDLASNAAAEGGLFSMEDMGEAFLASAGGEMGAPRSGGTSMTTGGGTSEGASGNDGSAAGSGTSSGDGSAASRESTAEETKSGEAMDGFGKGTLTDDTSAGSGEAGDSKSASASGESEGEGGETLDAAASAEGEAVANEVSEGVRMAAQLKASGNLEGAANAYRNALSRFTANADNMPLKDANGNSFFASTLDPAVRGLSDVLLTQASQSDKPQEAQAKREEVRDAMDLLGKEALRDYFQDKGIQALDNSEFKPEQLDPRTAMLYPVVLDDRTSLVLVSAHGNQQVDVAVDRATLIQAVNDYRLRLQTREHNRFLHSAQQLYDWLIRPLLGDLQAWEIDTLVVVPDGKLRTVPFSALHDGKQFLIEEFALAVTPALKLYPPAESQLLHRKVLTAGLSDPVQGFSALPSVPRELHAVSDFTGGDMVLNEAFVTGQLRQRLQAAPYGALHLATHAQFAGAPEENFVLTYDSKITLDHLQRLLGRSEEHAPLELISLSACQSALGDDKAALGLAGAAVKVGARSALGTLWFVDDEATAKAMVDFYRQLFVEQSPSKAMALQAVQKALIAQDRFWHPSYWAPFLLIGNWR
jgi:filamentous hemagglutinin family protein